MNTNDPPSLLLLQTFHEVARSGSVTAAARRLGRSQPAVSHRLRALERDMGVPLFEKVGRALRLTDYGRRLQAECLDLMARSQGIAERVRGVEGGLEGRVTIGTLHTVATHLLVPLLGPFFARHPRVALSFRFGTVSDLQELLRSGACDLIVVVGEATARGLDATPLGELSLAAIMTPDMAAGHRRRISPRSLGKRRYLAFGGDPDPTFDLIDEFARAHDLEDAYTPHVPHIETLRALAASGAGYALLPRYTTRRDRDAGRVVALAVDGLQATVPVSLVRRAEQVMTPALEAAFEALGALRTELARGSGTRRRPAAGRTTRRRNARPRPGR